MIHRNIIYLTSCFLCTATWKNKYILTEGIMFYHVLYVIYAQGYPILWDMTLHFKLNVFSEKKLRFYILNEFL